MIKRPLHARFGPQVLADIKRTTILPTAWPLNVPIMLYHWSGKPYWTPQVNLTPVQAIFTCPITIAHIHTKDEPSRMQYLLAASDTEALARALDTRPESIRLWHLEGFDSRADMDIWFVKTLKPGQTIQKHLMVFKRLPA